MVDSVFTVLLSNNMLVGGFIGFVLGNIIKGTKVERGMVEMLTASENQSLSPELQHELAVTYDLPLVMNFLRRHKIFSYCPFSPTYRTSQILE